MVYSFEHTLTMDLNKRLAMIESMLPHLNDEQEKIGFIEEREAISLELQNRPLVTNAQEEILSMIDSTNNGKLLRDRVDGRLRDAVEQMFKDRIIETATIMRPGDAIARFGRLAQYGR